MIEPDGSKSDATRQRATRALSHAIALAVLLGLGGCEDARSARPVGPNILLIVIDTLRADHLGIYGYPLATSPAIDALGAQSQVYDNHVASSAQTVPSTLSMMLSLHPAEHGFLHLGDGHFARNRPYYPDDLVFLPEVFQQAGYDTAGFVSNPFLKPESGFSQGFGKFAFMRGSGEHLTRAATGWLRARPAGARPFFLYLHYVDVHAPYRSPAEYHRRFEPPIGGELIHKNGPAPEGMRDVDLQKTVALYDAAIAFEDDQIAELLSTLDALGEREKTLIALTSDHGEEFLDHGGFGHGTSVYGELLRVPLLLSGPGVGPPARIRRLTHHLDLAPTLLALAGLEVPPGFRGKPLTETATVAFAEEGPWLAVHADGRKLVLDRRDGRVTLFDLADPLDQSPITDDSAERALREHARWYSALERVEASRSIDPPPPWSKAELERLRALGYAE